MPRDDELLAHGLEQWRTDQFETAVIGNHERTLHPAKSRHRDRVQYRVGIDLDPPGLFDARQEETAERCIARDADRATDFEQTVERDFIDTDGGTDREVAADLFELAQRRDIDRRAGANDDARRVRAAREFRDVLLQAELDR